MAEALTFIAGTSDHLLISNPRPLGRDSCRSHEEEQELITQFRDKTVADGGNGEFNPYRWAR